MNDVISGKTLRHGPMTLVLASALLLLAGCGSESSTARITADKEVVTHVLRVNSPAVIAQESADDYDANVSGLITGETLKRWMNDWEANRPAGITGRLVILQQTAGPAGFEYIKPDNVNVFTYREASWREPRSNGVIEMGHIVLSGPAIDRLLKKYGIDADKDLIVCAQGTGGSAAMNQGRCWYSFRYWGVAKEHLAILNGGNNHLSGAWGSQDFTNVLLPPGDQPSPLRNKQVSSVKDLLDDNTSLQATLEDVMAVLPLEDRNQPGDGYFLWDARSLEQFSAGEDSEAGGPVADRYTTFQNAASRQGHPRGALQLNWTDLIDTRTGLYKTKSELRAYLNGESVGGFQFKQGGDYQPVGVGNGYQPGDTVITWCETSARAAVSMVTTAVILGLPTRLYDGAMYEWNSLTAGTDKNGVALLPADSTWRTDVLSGPYFPNKPENIAPRNGWSNPADPAANGATTAARILDPYAAHADAVINEDKAYKTPAVPKDDGDDSTDAGPGGGIALPPNPCG